jgi:hypothetical protein
MESKIYSTKLVPNYDNHEVGRQGAPGYSKYTLNNKLHRIDGPAYIDSYENKYFLFGKEIKNIHDVIIQCMDYTEFNSILRHYEKIFKLEMLGL